MTPKERSNRIIRILSEGDLALEAVCNQLPALLEREIEDAVRELKNGELENCARINFENLERARPDVACDPYYRIAKAQLDEALGIMITEERFMLDLKRIERKQNGT